MEKTNFKIDVDDFKIDYDADAGSWYATDASGKRVASDPIYAALIAKLNKIKSQAAKA